MQFGGRSPDGAKRNPGMAQRATADPDPGFRFDPSGLRPIADERYRFTLACSAELCAASASLAEIAAVSAAVPQLGASLPLPQARGR